MKPDAPGGRGDRAPERGWRRGPGGGVAAVGGRARDEPVRRGVSVMTVDPAAAKRARAASGADPERTLRSRRRMFGAVPVVRAAARVTIGNTPRARPAITDHRPHTTPPPRLYRARDHRMVAGVAAGIAAHLGVSVVRVRVAFVAPARVSAGSACCSTRRSGRCCRSRGRHRRADPPGATSASCCPFVAIGLGVLLHPGAGLRLRRGRRHRRLAGRDHRGRRRRHLAPVRPEPAPAVERDDARRCRGSARCVDESDRRSFLLRFIGGGVLVAVGIIGVVAVYAPGRRASARSSTA